MNSITMAASKRCLLVLYSSAVFIVVLLAIFYLSQSSLLIRGLSKGKLYTITPDTGCWNAPLPQQSTHCDTVCNGTPSYTLTPSSGKSEDLLEKWKKQIFTTKVNLDTEKFTIVMLTYRRESVLPKVLLHYCKTPRLEKIVVIWNDVGKPIPDHIVKLTEECKILEFIRETENKITNRFKLRPQIKTECVFILDDDRWIKDLSDVVFAFKVWQENRHRMIGFEECKRSHHRDDSGQYFYDFGKPDQPASIMLTATGFLHRTYMDIYFTPDAILPGNILEDTDWSMYCDDILMNCVIGRFLELVSWKQPAIVIVKGKNGIEGLENEAAKESGFPGLSVARPDHYKRRSVCLNKVVSMFGHLPLPYTNMVVRH